MNLSFQWVKLIQELFQTTIKHSNLKVHPLAQENCEGKKPLKPFYSTHIVGGSIKAAMCIIYIIKKETK